MAEYPKFLLAHDAQRSFIIHLHQPRWIAELELTAGGCLLRTPDFIDAAGGADICELALISGAAAEYARTRLGEEQDIEYAVAEVPVADAAPANPLLAGGMNKEGFYCPLCRSRMMACKHVVDIDYLKMVACLASDPEPYKSFFA